MLAITKTTVREGIRKKLLYLFLGLAAFMTVVLLSEGKVRIDDRNVTELRMVAMVGLWMTLTFTSFLAVFVAMNAIGSEVERGTTHLALVRPVSRTRFWLERWLGVTVLAWLNGVVMLGALMLVLGWKFGPSGARLVAPALLILPRAAGCLTALVTALNTGLGSALAGLGGVALALLGFFRGQLGILADAERGLLGWLAGILVTLSPPLNLVVPQTLRLGGGEGLDVGALHGCLLYIYLAAGAGLLAFSRREV